MFSHNVTPCDRNQPKLDPFRMFCPGGGGDPANGLQAGQAWLHGAQARARELAAATGTHGPLLPLPVVLGKSGVLTTCPALLWSLCAGLIQASS